MWVPGERQTAYARRLGFSGPRCLTGVYTCDHDLFAGAPDNPERWADPAFLFVGRYSSEKGVDSLLEGYARYRRSAEAPWSLLCAGSGPLSGRVERAVAAQNLGFVHPRDLPSVMRRASAFVLPSSFEPWGVVVHEAASSSLPLICSHEVGASVHLVREGFNGWTVRPNDPADLAVTFERLAGTDESARRAMGSASYELSRQYSPPLWARTLIEGNPVLAGGPETCP